ncbi:hypothetical protein FJ936_09235 [Mesorhizobium sp. B2-4-13]|uniref:hypothetical protein n=1 Tax=Mesorhizobium sp. B2-4-13 TaxID=2589936 RepID=UPI00114F8DB2|nr:hypothetical protein [Mesorhizobium sp. B2-4-13]TPK85711.1 hypothetical protein FJ936_09235 [Mesorhizobium sp. B2-4-13]
MAKKSRNSGDGNTAAGTTRIGGAAKKAKKRKTPVRVGLHGLGRLLKDIDASAPGAYADFVKSLGSKDLTVTLSQTTARKIRDFVASAMPVRATAARSSNNNNCDPRTDPWCIDI